MFYFCSWESSAYGQESQGYDQYNQYGAADQTQDAYGQSAYGHFLPVHHLLSWPRVASPFFSPCLPFLPLSLAHTASTLSRAASQNLQHCRHIAEESDKCAAFQPRLRGACMSISMDKHYNVMPKVNETGAARDTVEFYDIISDVLTGLDLFLAGLRPL